jgi:flagellar motility protein MotE (MotC chaperone)
MYGKIKKLKNARVILTRTNDGYYLIMFKRLLEKGENPIESDTLKIEGRVQKIYTRMSSQAAQALCELLEEELYSNELLRLNQTSESKD